MMLRLLTVLWCVLFFRPAFAEEGHTIVLQIVPLEPFKAGHEQHAIARLSHMIDGSPVLADELAVSHTKKFHLLVIDEGLEDFQHLHPDIRELDHAGCPKWYSCNPGEYPFVWLPKYDRRYRAFADITPAESTQEYAMADMPHGANPVPATGSLNASDHIEVAHMRFSFTADMPPVAGQSSMFHLHVANEKGKPLCDGDTDCHILEPVLGAFAHVVGFHEDFKTVLHAHPMGGEPKDDDARGVPDLYIHILPPKPGFYRVFVQLKIGGKTLFLPFGINVNDASAPQTEIIKNP